MKPIRHFLPSKKKSMMPSGGMCRCGMGIKRAIMPLAVKKQALSQKMGISGRGGTLLLSDGLGAAEMNATGNGFGVKPMNTSLVSKLERLSVGKPKRKNVSMSF